MTKKAACGHAGISYDSLNYWEHRFASFARQVEEAEQEAEARYTGVIAKAAFGYEVIKTKRTVKPDGSIEALTETSQEFGWRAALEWLKRRRRKDWGDNLHIDLDEEISKLLAELTSPASHEPPNDSPS